MPIKGGVAMFDNDVEISFNVKGGRQYKRVFNDVVGTSIRNFSSMVTSLINLQKNNIHMYMQQLKLLLRYAHIDLLEGTCRFQINYNLWMANQYMHELLHSKDMKRIAELLNLDSILYSVEEAGFIDNQQIDTDFKVQANLSTTNTNIKLEIPERDSINDLITSLNANVQILAEFIDTNKPALTKIYQVIIKTAAKNLRE